jgi:F-type H+-transporting ATPase subunit delta
MVSIPATSGEFGVLPNHVATVAQLKPGVLAVHLEMDKNVKKARYTIAALRRNASRAAQRRAKRAPHPPASDAPYAFPLQYFVSSGFAFVHGDSSTDICGVEGVPLEQLDHEAVKQGLADYQAKLINAKDDYEKAAAQVGIEVCSAMNSALGG